MEMGEGGVCGFSSWPRNLFEAVRCPFSIVSVSDFPPSSPLLRMTTGSLCKQATAGPRPLPDLTEYLRKLRAPQRRKFPVWLWPTGGWGISESVCSLSRSWQGPAAKSHFSILRKNLSSFVQLRIHPIPKTRKSYF